MKTVPTRINCQSFDKECIMKTQDLRDTSTMGYMTDVKHFEIQYYPIMETFKQMLKWSWKFRREVENEKRGVII